ncbi:MAG TPA: phosphoglucosamine mutase [Terriglobia bacterium]|nr:phosphoglucosamine mutase [Terriglobia bacterium]
MGDKPLLFGTDGIRGVAGEYPLDRRTVWNLGLSLGNVLRRREPGGIVRVVLGQDTRESGSWIARRLAAGLYSSGAQVVEAGVITTPGLAFLTRHHGFSAGVVISASHNPYEDNGIKVLSNSGTKLPESLELAIERELAQAGSDGQMDSEPPLETAPHLLEDYLDRLLQLIPGGLALSQYRLVVDCAHGAACRVVPELLRRLGIEVYLLHVEPNGRNINLSCGSLYPQGMAEATQALSSDLGVAFDGDADRAIFATREGKLIDGDYILSIMAPFLQRCGMLKGSAVVGTLMTNFALEIALAGQGIGLKRTAVGDKYVLEEMLRSGINLGGEPSGHIIFADLSLAGDGIITLLEVLRLMAETGLPFEELTRTFKPFPQIIQNVRVKEKAPLESIPAVTRAIAECRSEIGDQGRVVVRYSGTEPLARVMVEAGEAGMVEFHAARIAQTIESALGIGRSGDRAIG